MSKIITRKQRIVQHQHDAKKASDCVHYLLVTHSDLVERIARDGGITREQSDAAIVKHQRVSAEASALARFMLFGED